MSEPILGPASIPHFVVKQLKPSKHGLSETDLVTSLQEVETQTQILGASFLKLHLDDPEWVIQTSGLVAVDEDGLLNELELEFPEGSGNFWRLAAVEGSTEISAANLILTFEDLVVARLREQWGHRTFPPGLTTRAQVVKALVSEANLKEHLKPPIKFVSPGVNRKEPVAEATPTKTSAAKTNQETKENRGRGVHAGASVTIGGSAATQQQIAEANVLLGVAAELNANPVATEALIYAAIGESKLGNDAGSFTPNSAGYYGVLQGSAKEWPDPHDTAGMAKAFMLGGKGFQGGGAKALSQSSTNPEEIAVKVEVPSIWPSNAYANEAGSAQFLPEAKAIIAAYGGVRPGGTTPTSSNESDVGQLSRGTPQNPDEDSWDCITRLAQEVDWNAFTDGRNTLFYMDGPDLIRQKPSVYIDVPRNHVIKEDSQGHKVEEYGVLIRPLFYNYDNTAFQYRATHKVKNKIQHKSRIAKPQTPSEVRMLMICGIDEFRGGDVFVFKNSGPISENGGRWVVADATRECMKYPYTKFILVPPTEPLPEPKATSTESTATVPGAGQATKGIPEGIPKAQSGAYRLPPTQGPTGTGTFQGITVAKWTIPMLEYAKAHGWKGQITSGYRPGVDPHTVTGVSEHSGTQYPHGAIDFGGFEPNPSPNREAFFEACNGFTGLTLIPAQFSGDGGHASGTGH